MKLPDKRCFEAVDNTLRDILSSRPGSSEKAFGGITTVLGGDFRQILPVVPNGDKYATLDACIKFSYLWPKCEVMHLHQNMRLRSTSLSELERLEVASFGQWILDVGNGVDVSSPDGTWTHIPSDYMITGADRGLEQITELIYPDVQARISDINYLNDRAILTPLNDTVEMINEHMLHKLNSDHVLYLSADSICKGDGNNEEDNLNYPPEFLNTLKFPGLPNHSLKLKIGVPVMLMRNLSQSAGLCNGTRMKITNLGRWSIEGEIINGPHIGEKVFLPRISLTPSDTMWPFVLKRRQFPITTCFAMTINKSQGQTLEHVGLYLPKQVFTHGQLYVAMSRVTNRQGLKILTTDEDQPDENMIKNIVYKEVL